MKDETSSVAGPLAAVIGDVVGSRISQDRHEVHRRLSRTLTAIQHDVPAKHPPAITAGDEFQGSYATVSAALQAAFLIRIRLADAVDVRFGIGWGVVEILDPQTLIQDGPAWWQARAAIEAVEQRAQRPGTRHARLCYRAGIDGAGPAEAAIDAALLCRDQLVGSLDMRALRILAGLMAGHSKGDIASSEQISPSAVSQRAQRDGLDVILTASAKLAEVA